MKSLLMGAAAVALLALPYAPAAAAQGTKTARGVVSTTSPDALTVKVGSSELTFKVDSSTKVQIKGGSTAMREARAKGQEHLPYTDFVKVGQTVEVAYHEAGMHADSIRVIQAGTAAAPAATASPKPAAPAAEPPAPKSMTASGTVTAVSATALTIKASTGEMTFAVDKKTVVVGRGLGTQAKEMQNAGEKTLFSEFVHKGDLVQIRYEDAAGAKHASEVRVTRKAGS